MAQAWPSEVRKRALEIYLEHGPAEASRQTGVPSGTVSQWARRAAVTLTRSLQTAAATEAHQASTFERMARIAENLLRIVDDRTAWVAAQPCDRDVVKTMTVAAIAVDKAQLLTGKATSRIETITPEAEEAYGKLLDLKRAG